MEDKPACKAVAVSTTGLPVGIYCLLFEYATTLGLLDIAYVRPHGEGAGSNSWGADDLDFISQYDGLKFIRVNALGAYALGLEERYQPEEVDLSVTMDKHGIVQLPGDVIPNDIRTGLNAYTERADEFQWKFTRNKLTESFVKQGSFLALYHLPKWLDDI